MILSIIEYGKDFRSNRVFCIVQFVQSTPFGDRVLSHLVTNDSGNLPPNWTQDDLKTVVAEQLNWNPDFIEFSAAPINNVAVSSA